MQSYMEDAAQHVGADMAHRILTGGPNLDLLEKGPQALPTSCGACGAAAATPAAAAAAPAGPKEGSAVQHHHDLHATHPGPDEGAGDSDVEEGCIAAEGSQDIGIAAAAE